MERKKYLGRANTEYFKSFISKVIRVDEDGLNGYAARVKIEEAIRPFMVGEKGAEICLGDTGYSEIDFLPDNENWSLSAMYDHHDKIIEWYVDITRKNAVDENGKPYLDDMYLDTVLMPDGRVLIFDEDELQIACDDGNITKYEFDMAYRVLNELQEKRILTIPYMENLCSRLLTLLT